MRVNGVSRLLQSGFSLIEILVTTAVLAVLLAVALPSYTSFLAQKNLKNVTEDLYNFIKTGQSQALMRHKSIYISFNPVGSWCYGMSDAGPCSCATANSCTVNSIETVVQSTNYKGTVPTIAVTGFSGSGGTPYIQIDGIRGIIAAQGTVGLSMTNLSTTITANGAGMVTICSTTVTGYPSC